MVERLKGNGRRRWRWLVGGLVGLELLYILAANSFLHQAWGRNLINRKPEKLTATWESASTWLPGLVSVQGLDLGGTSRRVAWRARLDRGLMFVWLPSLALRHVHILWGTPNGVEAELDVLPPPGKPKTGRSKRGWKVTLGGLDVEHLRRIRVGAYELAGSGSLDGKTTFQVRGPLELHLGRLRFDGAQVLSGGTVVANDVDLDGGFETAAYRPGEDKVSDLLGSASGSVHIGAHVENLGFLASYLREVSWLGFGGVGDLDLTVVLDEGSLLPGTALSVTGPEVRADFFDFRAQGRGTISGEVLDRGEELRLAAVLDEYSVSRRSDGAPILEGEGLETRVVNRSTHLEGPLTRVAGSLHVPPARVTSLAVLGDYLPPGTMATVTGGGAELSLDLTYDTEAHSGEGKLVIDAAGITGTFGDADVSGDLKLEANLARVSILKGTFDLGGTDITIADGRIVRHGRERTRDWWGRIRVRSGTVQRRLLSERRRLVPSAPALISADFDGSMLDTAPIVVLMEQRLPKLGWLHRLLTVPDIELRGTVMLEGSNLGLHALHVTGGKDDQLEIRAELDLAGRETSGVAYTRYRGLDAVLALNLGERRWRLRGARTKYEEASAAYNSILDKRKGTTDEALAE